MRKHAKTIIILCLVLLVGVWAGSAIWRFVMTRFAITDALYAGVSFEDMLTGSDLSFAGMVLEIGDARWNQDNGLPWTGDDAFIYHTITCLVAQPIAGTALEGTMEEKIVLTIVGSPSPGSDKQHIVMENDQILAVGDQVIVFARQTELIWRKPDRKPVTVLAGYPPHSILVKSKDGLYRSTRDGPYTFDEVARLIEAKRNAE